MSAVPYDLVPKSRGVTYDGTNSSELEELLDIVITGESGGRLDFTSDTGIWYALAGWCITYRQDGIVTDCVDPTRFARELVRLPDFAGQTAAFADLGERVDGLETLPQVLAVGAATFTAVGSGDTVINVDVQPAQADSSYTPRAQLFGGVNLGNLSITDLTVVDANTVAVTVHNSGLVALGASVLVSVIP